MNELVRLGGLPRSKLLDTIFSTTSCYLEALADLNIEHMVHRRNDAVESVDDCRRNHMQRSWDSGNFWVVYAALNSFAFDAIYWEKIDPLFFKAAQSLETAWKERLGLLGENEIEEMEQLVVRKLEEMKTRILRWDPDEYTVEAVAKVAEVDGAY
ncbi:hypothetical protein N7463_005542 [Penicillium fimorum]|uniref:Uncharacterized protein n=1 Tax=Penicillium fimorum TaxID=1882269 RepID=A0A9X0C584_9EURO|nr:hypothetical protein N7463_005542 [Penicillium fimorum]